MSRAAHTVLSGGEDDESTFDQDGVLVDLLAAADLMEAFAAGVGGKGKAAAVLVQSCFRDAIFRRARASPTPPA